MSERTFIEITRGDGTEEIILVELIDGLAVTEAARADQSWEGPFFDMAARYANLGLGIDQLPPSWVWNWRVKMEEEAAPEWRRYR